MKNKILILPVLFIMGFVFLSSCYEKTELFHTPEAGDGQFAQLFSTEMQFDINKLDATGVAADMDVMVDVRILGEKASSMTFNEDFAVTLELSACQYFPFFVE